MSSMFGWSCVWQNNLRFPDDVQDVSEAAQDLICRLITVQERRLGQNNITDFVEHPFFEGIDWDQLRQCECVTWQSAAWKLCWISRDWALWHSCLSHIKWLLKRTKFDVQCFISYTGCHTVLVHTFPLWTASSVSGAILHYVSVWQASLRMSQKSPVPQTHPTLMWMTQTLGQM